ncbi:iron chelate uptake ABC transporter family permease subunit [Paenibacillus campinasensis]|uniref:Iron chelate uptake ABC transporter family permease subunit n=1 Tax=Paenibacillus campinasensis TaxID=66347 RepID=A0ABW9T6P2_9BACL|nr:iron chelate uptake ABC transporter family permease subunit [Paenibacillus campinasensis]MUG69010.1 iron chelate uptake ABC transporter family permease subunit [Paenibacillus campinasensis]
MILINHVRKNIWLSILISLILLLICMAISIFIGSRSIPFLDVIQVLRGNTDYTLWTNIVRARISRTVFGLIAGGALGVSGALMQSITRNPVADPSILGVNTGASLFVVCGMSFFNLTMPEQYIWLAFAGGALTAIFVYIIASVGASGISPIKLALAGAATSIAFSSLVSTITLPDTNIIDKFRFWQVGSISGTDWSDIGTVTPYLVIGLLLAIVLIPSLNTLALGDETATGLGIKVTLVRCLGGLAGVLLCCAVTALAGPIGFIGLVIPHMIRLVFGPDLRFIIPFSMIGGACLLLLSDSSGRLLGYPGEIEVGIVTAIIGAPWFILVIRKFKVSTL